jgi:glyoxylase-like metal-dependent hydrolase (beta-lactamase superfamily II)
MQPTIQAFYDSQTFTISYLVSDPVARRGVIIDPVLDFDPKSARTATGSADRILTAAATGDIAIDWILETHAHAFSRSAGWRSR